MATMFFDFRRQELVCRDEDAFDSLTKGSGCTWLAVLCVHEQTKGGLKDVHAFFGNLRNGVHFEGLWGCVRDDNTLWWGARNGVTFGRFDKNNPQVLGPKLEIGRFYIVAGRMAAGAGKVKLESLREHRRRDCQRRDRSKQRCQSVKIGHRPGNVTPPITPGSLFDGEIARFLIFKRPLVDKEVESEILSLREYYSARP